MLNTALESATKAVMFKALSDTILHEWLRLGANKDGWIWMLLAVLIDLTKKIVIDHPRLSLFRVWLCRLSLRVMGRLSSRLQYQTHTHSTQYWFYWGVKGPSVTRE